MKALLNRARIEESAKRADQALQALALVMEEEGAPEEVLVNGARSYLEGVLDMAFRRAGGREGPPRYLRVVK